MDKEILEKFERQEKKLDEIYKSAEKTRRYFLWTLIITVLTILLPLVALAFILPWFFKMLSSAYGL